VETVNEPLWLDQWAEYAKDRYESARSGIIEFRAWARQLLTAVAVVVGLEMSLLLRVVELRGAWRIVVIVWLLATVVYQLLIARKLVRLGYQMVWVPSEIPCSPAFARFRLSQGTKPPKELLAEQYSQAYRDRRMISKQVAGELATESKGFVKSIIVGLTPAMAFAMATWVFQPAPPSPSPPTVVIVPSPR
jgi:hypothetical protein